MMMPLLDDFPPDVTKHRRIVEEETSTAVVFAVAEATDTDALELTPLYEVLDPDALDRFFNDEQRNSRSCKARLIFPFEDCWVAVRSDDQITVVPQEELDVLPSSSQRELYQAKHEWTTVPPLSTTLLQALKQLPIQRDLLPRKPLTTIIDLDSLDRLFAPIDKQSRRDAGWLSFSAYGYLITIHSGGQIRFAPATRSPQEGAV